MSLYHYIGANRELPLGQRGGVAAKFKDGEIEEYDSMQDLAGIYIEPLHERNVVIKKHFGSTYVYGIAANWGGFFLNPLMKKDFPEDYKAHVKCIEELFRLMKDYGTDGDEFELYSCWYGEENEARDDSLTRDVDLHSFTLSDDFKLKDKQYIKIKL